MNFSKIPLSKEDRDLLQQKYRLYAQMTAIFAGAVILLLIGFAHEYIFGDDHLGRAIVFSIAGLPVGIAIFMNFLRARDLKSGEKEIGTGQITRKFTRTNHGEGGTSSQTTYYFEIEEKNYAIPSKYYENFNENDTVTLHRGTITKSVFLVEN